MSFVSYPYLILLISGQTFEVTKRKKIFWKLNRAAANRQWKQNFPPDTPTPCIQSTRIKNLVRWKIFRSLIIRGTRIKNLVSQLASWVLAIGIQERGDERREVLACHARVREKSAAASLPTQ